MNRLKLAFPYLLLATMAALVVWSNVRGRGEAPQQAAEHGRAIDPVCHMQVNPNWGLFAVHEGVTFHFCHQRCVEKFTADPESFITERCPVCKTPIDHATALTATYLDKTYRLDSDACRAKFKADPASYFMHTMWGIPDWLYYASIALVLAASFVMFEALPGGRGGPPPRVNLMRLAFVGRFLRSRPARFTLQAFMAAIFLLIIIAGLFGHQNPALNIAPMLTWTVWWCGLVVLILYAGKAWCYACPWDALATWVERLRLWKKTDTGLGLGLKWPRALRNIWLATILFVGLTWVEIGFGVTMKPAGTAWIAIAMLLLAVVSAFLFERKSFCRYGCLVGRVSGLYALFAPVEVRAADPDRCATCRTKECVRGGEQAYGCPTFEYVGKMAANTYCIQCAECIQACPHENLAVNLRPWGADLATPGTFPGTFPGKFPGSSPGYSPGSSHGYSPGSSHGKSYFRWRSDEAYLALLMLAISGFHGLTMTPLWPTLTGSLDRLFPAMVSFTFAMAALMIGPILVYALLTWWSYHLSKATKPHSEPPTSFGDYFIRYAYCVLPIALFYHLAHNLEHLLMEGPKVVALASDPLGRGWNILGTAGLHPPPMVSLDVLWIMQVVLVGVGHVYSLAVARGISGRLFPDAAAARRGQWPLLLGMIAFSVFSLWLLKQPMQMRSSAM